MQSMQSYTTYYSRLSEEILTAIESQHVEGPYFLRPRYPTAECQCRPVMGTETAGRTAADDTTIGTQTLEGSNSSRG